MISDLDAQGLARALEDTQGEGAKPLLVDFWAAWCGPCKAMHPTLEACAQERDDVRVVRVDVDANPETAAQWRVLALPTLALFRDGALADRLVGATSADKLRAWLDARATRNA